MDYKIEYLKRDEKLITNLDKTIIINKILFKQIVKEKKRIDLIPSDKWKLIRTIITDYEFVGNNKYHSIKKLKDNHAISRAYYKLWEILSVFENEMNVKTSHKEGMNMLGLAEAPGGFIQCVIDYRKNKKDNFYGISLRDAENNRIPWVAKLLKENNIHILFGDEKRNHDGNLYNPEIITFFDKYYKNNKMDLVTADGGFLISMKEENQKGQLHNQLFLCETYMALITLKNGGHFVLKVYDLNNKFMIDLIYILSNIFEIVHTFKPVTSREMNSEHYLVCINFNQKKFTKKIKSTLFKVIKTLWNDKDIILTSLINEKNKDYKKVLNQVKNYNIKNMSNQLDKLTDAIKLSKNDNFQLKQKIKDIHRKKSKYAYSWIEKHNF